MARIWYSVCGEGLGHAVRSHTILSHLKHEVFITAADRAYPYLKERHENVHEITGNMYVYEDNAVRRRKTVTRFIKNLPSNVYQNLKLLPAIRRFNPDLIISDFEPTANYFCRMLRKPCIAIDNIHILNKCRISVKKPFYINLVLKTLEPPVDHYYITSFYRPAKCNENVTIVPPIIRKEVRALKPAKGDFVLVYQTSPTNVKMLPVLESRREKYKIYGMPGQKSRGNLEFVDFGDHFLQDLRRCRYVIVNGGFTVISEAMYLKKPVLCLPIAKQFEQEFNGIMVKKKGFGSWAMELGHKDLDSFEKNLEKYRDKITALPKWNDDKLISEINAWAAGKNI